MKKMSPRPPSFICIGAQKAGTSWLYDNLCHHPDVCMPPVKELHFFNTVCAHEQLLGVETYNPLVLSKLWRYFIKNPSLNNICWLKMFYLEPKSIKWYLDLFGRIPSDKCVGDITPGYSTLDERGVAFAHRVLSDECKVFIILRNPVERLWSSLKMHYRWKGGNIRNQDLESLVAEMRTASHYLRTDYARMVTLWQKYFENFKIFLFDDLCENPVRFLFEIEDYLGIKQFSYFKTLEKKCNADKEQVVLPTEIRKLLLSEYADAMNNLESLLPGIKARWTS